LAKKEEGLWIRKDILKRQGIVEWDKIRDTQKQIKRSSSTMVRQRTIMIVKCGIRKIEISHVLENFKSGVRVDIFFATIVRYQTNLRGENIE